MLVWFRQQKASFFDLKTGVFLQKVSLPDEIRSSRVSYDFTSNAFYAMKENESMLHYFTISNFKKGGEGHGFTKQYLNSRIASIRSLAFGKSDSSDHKPVQMD